MRFFDDFLRFFLNFWCFGEGFGRDFGRIFGDFSQFFAISLKNAILKKHAFSLGEIDIFKVSGFNKT